jgi:hypothetical protein
LGTKRKSSFSKECVMKKKIDLNDPDAWSNLDWDEPVVPSVLKKTDATINKGRANRLKAEDPNLRQRQHQGILKKKEDPTWAENMLRGMYEIRDINPEWRDNISKGRKAWLKTEEGQRHIKKVRDGQTGNPEFNKACKEGNKTRWLKEDNLSTCPHCNARVDNANYNKHHGDSCVFKGKKIVCYNGKTKVCEYYSREDVENDGLKYEQVRNCVNGKREAYKRYTFKWVNK